MSNCAFANQKHALRYQSVLLVIVTNSMLLVTKIMSLVNTILLVTKNMLLLIKTFGYQTHAFAY